MIISRQFYSPNNRDACGLCLSAEHLITQFSAGGVALTEVDFLFGTENDCRLSRNEGCIFWRGKLTWNLNGDLAKVYQNVGCSFWRGVS
jgi:hypothetical protein